jgi:hypothetical protein
MTELPARDERLWWAFYADVDDSVEPCDADEDAERNFLSFWASFTRRGMPLTLRERRHAARLMLACDDATTERNLANTNLSDRALDLLRVESPAERQAALAEWDAERQARAQAGEPPSGTHNG